MTTLADLRENLNLEESRRQYSCSVGIGVVMVVVKM